MPPSPPSPTTLSRANQRLGAWMANKWRLDRVLGVGGMGVVYEARHRNGKRVAIKFMHPELTTHDDVVKRFLREGYLANAVEHPAVVSVLDDGLSDDGVPFLVMEYLEGENLDARLERLDMPLSLPDTLSIGVALLDALEVAHGQGIIHRDIKPENIFLTATGGVKILDFGIANVLDSMHASTRPGTIVGTPTFMPREQAQGPGGKVNEQSDLWAVGATLFFALTAEFLYKASSLNEFFDQLMSAQPRSLRELAPHIPEAIAAVIERALEHDRTLRWKTAADMKLALRMAAKDARIDIPPSPSLAGYVPLSTGRPSLISLSEEMRASLTSYPPPSRSSHPPSSRSSHPSPTPHSFLPSTLPGPMPERPSRWRWAPPVLFVALGLGTGLVFWRNPPRAPVARAAASAPAPAPDPPPLPPATSQAPPTASASAPAATPPPPSASSSQRPPVPLARQPRPAGTPRANSPEKVDLGATRD